ncbi:hypothetical protein TIFTF001_022121 [Ficus carica]|uniref:Uncharacterized protein n=1 Tax=Ficus carica TaxID=3494 RepID=A0AA88DCK1_FICCA|nr:hypothetical protein TIFTF001_022121 [Ficus carica]
MVEFQDRTPGLGFGIVGQVLISGPDQGWVSGPELYLGFGTEVSGPGSGSGFGTRVGVGSSFGFVIEIRVEVGFRDRCYGPVSERGSGSGFRMGVGVGFQDGDRCQVLVSGLWLGFNAGIKFLDGARVKFWDMTRG